MNGGPDDAKVSGDGPALTPCRPSRQGEEGRAQAPPPGQPSGLKAKSAVLMDGAAEGSNQKVSWMWLAVT